MLVTRVRGGSPCTDTNTRMQSGGLTGFKAPGQAIPGVTDPDDPRLLSTASSVSGAHGSSGAFAAPIFLLVFLVAVAAVVIWRARRARQDGSDDLWR